jgi:DNA-binding GntR family transcriptional regulator
MTKDETPGGSATDRVYRLVRKDVLECRWRAGQRLTIRDIAADLGVSPMPVRTAFRRLGAEGVLIIEENKSAQVPFISRKMFNEYFEIAVSLECLALERASGKISKETLQSLRQEADSMQQSVEAGDTVGYARRFNSLLMKIYIEGDSPALIDMIESVWIKTAPPSREAFEERGIVTRLNAALLAVLDALEVADAASAKDILASVLKYAGKSVNLFLEMDQDQKLKPKTKKKNEEDHVEAN